jgi:hypothetical protein
MSEPRRSVTFTALIFFGMLVALVGLVLVAFGLGGTTTFEFSLGEIEVKTTSTGLAILAVGAAISAGVAMNLPEGVQVFGRTRPTLSERLKQLTPLFVIVAVVAGVAFLISVVV